MSTLRRLVAVLLAACAVLGTSGCGTTDDVEKRAERVRRDVDRRLEQAQKDFEERRQRFGKRFRQILRGLEKVFERPEQTSPRVRSRGRNEPQTIDAFLTDVLGSVDRYWTKTFTASDLPEPRVKYVWIPPGSRVLTGCGQPADDNAAFYCPADDTIYVAQRFAAELYDGVLRGLPGQEAGYGRAAGDFAVAYVVAHEYSHNLQQELGVFDNDVSQSAMPFELQADCLAGTWAYSVYAAGDLKPDDLDEITNAALAVGDFDLGNAQHHGTPQERRTAVLTGFRNGRPADCERYIPA